MSDKAAAAQKWAEANDALAKATETLRAAEDAYKSAQLADLEAWTALEGLSGRAPTVPTVTVTTHRLPQDAWPVTHSLPVKPLG